MYLLSSTLFGINFTYLTVSGLRNCFLWEIWGGMGIFLNKIFLPSPDINRGPMQFRWTKETRFYIIPLFLQHDEWLCDVSKVWNARDHPIWQWLESKHLNFPSGRSVLLCSCKQKRLLWRGYSFESCSGRHLSELITDMYAVALRYGWSWSSSVHCWTSLLYCTESLNPRPSSSTVFRRCVSKKKIPKLSTIWSDTILYHLLYSSSTQLEICELEQR